MKIVTVYNRMTPHPSLDWCAFVDGDEERGIYGWGATEAEAIADLKDLLEES